VTWGRRLHWWGQAVRVNQRFIKLAERALFRLNSGEILVDGKDIRAITLLPLSKNFGTVPQECGFVWRNYSRNIAYGNPQANGCEILEAARKAYAWSLSMPSRRLDTIVGERGLKLSVGKSTCCLRVHPPRP